MRDFKQWWSEQEIFCGDGGMEAAEQAFNAAIEMNSKLAEAFAKRLDEKQALIDELQDFAIWMTGCGYEFTQHEYFIEQRDKLLKSV